MGDSATSASVKEENYKVMHLQSIYDYAILAYDDVGVDVTMPCSMQMSLYLLFVILNKSS